MLDWFVQVVWKLLELTWLVKSLIWRAISIAWRTGWLLCTGFDDILWLGWIYCKHWCFSLFSYKIVSDGSDKPMMWCYSCKVWSSQKSRVWGSKLFWCIEGRANTEDRATTFIDSPQLHWTAWTLQINQSAVFCDLNQFLLKEKFIPECIS